MTPLKYIVVLSDTYFYSYKRILLKRPAVFLDLNQYNSHGYITQCIIHDTYINYTCK